MHYPKHNEKFMKLVLVNWIIQQYPNCLIALEVPFLGKQRRIDLLVITEDNQLLIFELKSKLDQLKTLADQINDYSSCFSNVYIVTDPKFLTPLCKMGLPSNIGQICIDTNRQVNLMKHPKDLKKTIIYNILTILKKQELSTIIGHSKLNIHELRNLIISSFSNIECSSFISNLLIQRYTKQNELFRIYKSDVLTYEDLIYLDHSFHSRYQSYK